MKKKISRILGVAVCLAMLTGLMVSATPVSGADPLKWGDPNNPASYAEVVIGTRIPLSDVKDYAVAENGTTMYACLGTFKYPYPAQCYDPYTTTPAKWYIAKSTSAGAMWSWVEVKDDEGDLIPSTAINQVAIASDSSDGAVTAIVYDSTKVAFTEDGGATWTDLETPYDVTAASTVSVIYDIAINREVAGSRYIAVCGRSTDGDAGLWYFDIGGGLAAKWIDAMGSATWDQTGKAAGDAAMACMFSPNFPSDRTIVVITGPDAADADATAEPVIVQLANFNSKAFNDLYGTQWTGGASVFQTTAGATINLDATTAALLAASISLPTSYIASDDAARIVFVGVATSDTDPIGGIYRFDDEEPTELEIDQISSVAYNTDEDKLVAGAYDNNQVHRSDNPMTKEPDVYQATSLKRPGANDTTSKIQVAWAGTKVVAGSQGLDSCFSVSTTDGKAFTDIAFIDHSIAAGHDFDITADGSKIYFITDDGNDMMLWAGLGYGWSRVLLVDDACETAAPNKEAFLVRVAPDNKDVVYLGEIGSNTIYYSDDGGATKWMRRYCGIELVDLAVESASVVYAVDVAGFVSKSEDGGFVWSAKKVDTGIGNGATIVSIAKDKLIVGGTAGGVAYSTDGGATFKKMGAVGTANVQICADGLDSGSHIYAATDKAGGDYVYRATLPGTTWTKITDDPLDNPCYGIGISSDGVLYVLTAVNGYSFTELLLAGPTSLTYTTANFTGDTFIPGSLSLYSLKSDFVTVNDFMTDNDDPTDTDFTALCGGTGTVTYATQALTFTFDEAVYYVGISYNSESPVYRCLTPTADEDDVIEAWSTIGGPGLELDSPNPDTTVRDLGPRALRITGNKLWGITKPHGTSAGILTMTDSIQIPTAGPGISAPADKTVLTINKQTGRSVDLVLQWTRPEKTVTAYELEVAYDSDFKALVQPTIDVVDDAATVVVVIGPWTESGVTTRFPNGYTKIEFMANTTYYWRVRVTEPFFSPWSTVRNFSVEPLEVAEPEPAPVLEPTVLTPSFAAEDVSIRPTFSWTAIAGATYEFVLAEDLGLDDPFEIIDYSATCDINAHVAREDLKYSTTYHWRVRSISAAGTSTWVRGIFTTGAAPAEPTPPVVIEEAAPTPAPEIILEVPPTPAPVQVIPDYLLWVIVAVGAVLIIAVIVLIVRTRRVT